jgi:hypothetical protein
MVSKSWLLTDYADAVALIDRIEAENRAAGKKTRRNWWDTLAGGIDGRPYTVNGIEFPVLRAAQIRQGKPVTPNAICRNPDEVPPDVIATNRWPRRRLPSKTRRPSTKHDHSPSNRQRAG